MSAITALPTAPSRSMSSSEFVDAADAWLAALDQWTTEVNTVAAAVNITKWISGTTYAIGDVVWSPTDKRSYRRIVAGAGATDPVSDAVNWSALPYAKSGANTDITSLAGVTGIGNGAATHLQISAAGVLTAPAGVLLTGATNSILKLSAATSYASGNARLEISGTTYASPNQLNYYADTHSWYDKSGVAAATLSAAGVFNTIGNITANSGAASVTAKNTAKAWVRGSFATTVPVIGTAFNVSSFTDNGPGDATVNFTTAMADANYAFVGMCGNATATANLYIIQEATSAPATGSFRFYTLQSGVGAVDLGYFGLAFFGS